MNIRYPWYRGDSGDGNDAAPATLALLGVLQGVAIILEGRLVLRSRTFVMVVRWCWWCI